MDNHDADTKLQIDVNALAKSELPFVALESTRQDPVREKLDAMKECVTFPDLEQSQVGPIKVPAGKYTTSLLAAWLISLLGSFQYSVNVGGSGAVHEDAVFPSHSSLQWSISVAIMSIGGLIGSLVAGPMGTTWSRRRGILLTVIMYAASGVLMGGATDMYMLIVGRFIQGLAAGVAGIFIPLYIREISAPNQSGTLGTGFQVSGTLGVLAADCLAFAFSGKYQNLLHPGWRFLFGSSTLIGIVQLLLMPFLVESPCWLVSMGRENEAAVVLMRLRGTPDVSIELQSIHHDLQLSRQDAEHEVGFLDVLRDRSIRRPLVITCLLMVFQQLSGINAVFYYANQFFEDAGLQNPLVGTTLAGVVNFGMTCVALVLMDRVGRRCLLLLSCSGILVSQIVITLALLSILPFSTTVSVIGVLFFIAFYEIGYGPIPWLIVSELLPPAPRSTGMAIALTFQWMCTFIVSLVFPTMQSGLGNYSFVPFATIVTMALIFTLCYVPETRGKSLEEVQQALLERKTA